MAPVRFHKKLSLRAAFASFNFLLPLGLLTTAYSYSAWHLYENRTALQLEQAVVDVSGRIDSIRNDSFVRGQHFLT